MLIPLIDKLDEAIGAGANAATLRTLLANIREQAEAVDAELEQLRVRTKELETRGKEQPLAPDTATFDETTEKILQMFFDAGRAFPIERVAQSLGLARSTADYHVDKLVAANLLQSAGYNPASGTLYFLTLHGRAHVVERQRTQTETK